MKAWRIVPRKYGRTRRAVFGGLSGFWVDGRWHTAGRHLDYAAQSLSLAILEHLVHYKRLDGPLNKNCVLTSLFMMTFE